MPFSFPSLVLISKIARLRDEAQRAVALLPQINAAIAAPTIVGKLELFAPISSEVLLILASGLKDLDLDNLTFGSEQDLDYAFKGNDDYEGVKEFLAKLSEFAKMVKPYLPFILMFLEEDQVTGS